MSLASRLESISLKTKRRNMLAILLLSGVFLMAQVLFDMFRLGRNDNTAAVRGALLKQISDQPLPALASALKPKTGSQVQPNDAAQPTPELKPKTDSQVQPNIASQVKCESWCDGHHEPFIERCKWPACAGCGCPSPTSASTYKIADVQKKPRKAAFIHIPKTGGSKLEDVIGMTILNPSKIVTIDKKPHWTCSRRHIPPSWFDEDQYTDRETFTMIRDPYSRLISEYRFMCWGPRKTAAMKHILGHDLGTASECKYNSKQMSEYLAVVLPKVNSDPSMASETDCHFVPQAEYAAKADHVFCSAEPLKKYVSEHFKVDALKLAAFRDQKMYEKETRHLTPEVLKLINTLYAEDFKLCDFPIIKGA